MFSYANEYLVILLNLFSDCCMHCGFIEKKAIKKNIIYAIVQVIFLLKFEQFELHITVLEIQKKKQTLNNFLNQ